MRRSCAAASAEERSRQADRLELRRRLRRATFLSFSRATKSIKVKIARAVLHLLKPLTQAEVEVML